MDSCLLGQPWAFQEALETSTSRAFLLPFANAGLLPEEVVLHQLEGFRAR